MNNFIWITLAFLFLSLTRLAFSQEVSIPRSGEETGIEVKANLVSEKESSEQKSVFSKIVWGTPVMTTSKNSKLREFSLFGFVENQNNLSYELGKYILWIREDKNGKQSIKKISIRNLIVKNKDLIQINSDGSFLINIKLPNGSVNIPFFVIENKKKSKYQLSLVIKDSDITMTGVKKAKSDCKYCVWLGTGFSYLSYKQDPPQDIKEVDYGALGFPAFTLRTSLQASKDWIVRFSYHYLTGPELESQELTIGDKKIIWKHMGLELDYRLTNPFWLFGFRLDPALLIGFQNQDMPFLVQDEDSNYNIESFKFNTISVGGLTYINSFKTWYYEVYMRIQSALKNSNKIELKSGFVFDGSIGAIRRITENLKLGLFWGGQYHSYKYSIYSSSGTYSFLNSKIDLSLGIEY